VSPCLSYCLDGSVFESDEVDKLFAARLADGVASAVDAVSFEGREGDKDEVSDFFGDLVAGGGANVLEGVGHARNVSALRTLVKNFLGIA